MTIWTPFLASGKPRYLAIADALAQDIAAGALKPGDRLPPQRDLAWRLKVTVGTVTRGYKEAELRGLLQGEVGRGSYVRGGASLSSIPRRASDGDGLIDLTHAVPPPVVSTSEFDAALSHVMRETERLRLLDYTSPEGDPRHRMVGAKWLARCGVEVAASDVVVTAGAYMALVAIIPDIVEGGEAVMAENLNYPVLRPALKRLGLGTIGLEMDEQGLLPQAFEQAARTGESRLLYLVPTLHNPTTGSMPRARREAIVAIARRYNITIVEDDVFRLLVPRVQPPPLYALAPERTFYVTSLSKILAPGLRVGFVATPAGRGALLREHHRVASGRAVGMTMEMARFWLETDIADAITHRVIAALAERRVLFLDIFKGKDLRCEPGAPYAWLALPDWWKPSHFVDVLDSRGVKVSPGTAFAIGARANERFVRVCFGQPTGLDDLRRSFHIIRELMDEVVADDFRPVA